MIYSNILSFEIQIHTVLWIDQLAAICKMLLVTTLSFVWGHEINNMMPQCIYSPRQIKTGVSDDAKGEPASSTSMTSTELRSFTSSKGRWPWEQLVLQASRCRCAELWWCSTAFTDASKTYACSGNLQAHHKALLSIVALKVPGKTVKALISSYFKITLKKQLCSLAKDSFWAYHSRQQDNLIG